MKALAILLVALMLSGCEMSILVDETYPTTVNEYGDLSGTLTCEYFVGLGRRNVKKEYYYASNDFMG